MLDRLFELIDTDAAARRLLDDEGLSFDHPHHQAGTFLGRRRVLTLTMCGERRQSTPMHRIAVAGRDPEGRQALEGAGLSVRPARRGSASWRYETCVRDFPQAVRIAGDVTLAVDASVRVLGRFGSDRGGPASSSSLPCIPAASVRPGMAMFTAGGGYDVVEAVEEVELDRPVYDINVDGTHNFVAGGLVTHNSVYSFRGADIRNILEFEHDYPDADTVLLEQNYRSTQTILDAANGLIAHNVDQKPKHLWTDGARGEQIVVGEFDDEHAEARYVASEINRLVEEGDAARPDRRLLPRQRPEPGARGHAGALRDPLPGDRRDEVLRPRRDQGRGRLPAAAREPGRRDLVLAGRQLAAPRDRPADPGAAALAREHDRRGRAGGARAARCGSRRSARRR